MSDLGFGPSTSVLHRSNSFEDETENLYHSDLLGARRVDDQGIQSILSDSSGVLKVEPDNLETMVTVNPALITGQSLAMKMKVDKMRALEMSVKDEDTFDLDAFVNNHAAGIVPTSVDETEERIREMEEFLSQYEDAKEIGSSPDPDNLADQLLSMEQQQTLSSMDTTCPVINGDLSADEVEAAEAIVDELLLKAPEQTDILAAAVKSENLHDSGFVEEPSETSFNVSNISQFNTNEGRVIIVIAPPSDATFTAAPSEATFTTPPSETLSTASSPAPEDSDSDWSPEEEAPKRKPGRKPSARQPLTFQGGRVTKKSYKTIKDKKERKKLQNVEAARRYRDKKKLKELEAENEEQMLIRKNRDLKEQLRDVENEMKTMKRLMVELGIFKR